jgi:flagellar biogenesis protein FliO
VGISSFAVAVVLLVGALMLLRRKDAGSAMRVIARLPVEPRRSLLVVELAGRTLVLASSEAGLSLLTELDAVAAAQLTAASAPPTRGLAALAASFVGRRA